MIITGLAGSPEVQPLGQKQRTPQNGR